jgi:uncharacterized pyridoxamine 5'-phosphate oxidase family protein
MKQMVEYLKENSVGQLATIKDGQIAMRPFHFLFEDDGKFIFTTSTAKDVYKQLKENPTAGFAVMGKDGKWLRIKGSVMFDESLEMKKRVFELAPHFQKIYKTADNPAIKVFCIHSGSAGFHNLNGEIIEEFKF